MADYIVVYENEDAIDGIEFELDEDESLMISTIQVQFCPTRTDCFITIQTLEEREV